MEKTGRRLSKEELKEVKNKIDALEEEYNIIIAGACCTGGLVIVYFGKSGREREEPI